MGALVHAERDGGQGIHDPLGGPDPRLVAGVFDIQAVRDEDDRALHVPDLLHQEDREELEQKGKRDKGRDDPDLGVRKSDVSEQFGEKRVRHEDGHEVFKRAFEGIGVPRAPVFG